MTWEPEPGHAERIMNGRCLKQVCGPCGRLQSAKEFECSGTPNIQEPNLLDVFKGCLLLCFKYVYFLNIFFSFIVYFKLKNSVIFIC